MLCQVVSFCISDVETTSYVITMLVSFVPPSEVRKVAILVLLVTGSFKLLLFKVGFIKIGNIGLF
jgi:hypothetical protein